MEFKKLLFVLAVTTTVIFVCLWGSSYAYYTYSEGTSLDVTTGNIDTGVAVIFTQSEYINTLTGVPITSANVDTQASKTMFSLVPDSTILAGYQVANNIKLVDFSIAEELRVSDFKYDLICNDGTSTKTIASGRGDNITDEMIQSGILELGTLSTSAKTFDVTKTYNCSFRVWLEETGANQNSLMNKKFMGRIYINSVFKK